MSAHPFDDARLHDEEERALVARICTNVFDDNLDATVARFQDAQRIAYADHARAERSAAVMLTRWTELVTLAREMDARRQTPKDGQ